MAKVLVAEDEPGIALGLEDTLRLEGYQVEVVTTGTTASRRALEERFDLILLDVMLPGKSGFDVCRELRQSGLEAPIIFLTARVQEADRISGLDLGANDYVTKPFSPRELMATGPRTGSISSSLPSKERHTRCLPFPLKMGGLPATGFSFADSKKCPGLFDTG